MAANTMLLQRQHAKTPALDTYRSATTLLRTTLLVRAQDMVNEQTSRLNADYQAERRRIAIAWIALTLVGVPLVVLLAALQVFLGRRFRRMFNPAVLAASALTVALLGGAGLTLGQHAHRLHTAKQDAFDSIVALSQARAISYDANADESRYLLDPRDADAYQQAFLMKTQQIMLLPGSTLEAYDRGLEMEWQAYRADPHPVGWGGALGVEFRNITFTGERDAAELTVRRFEAYQLIDRRIRRLPTTGHKPEAIALCTSYAPGGSNNAFELYDSALSNVIAINTRAFDAATHADTHALNVATWLPLMLAVGISILLAAGVRPRLAEYR